MCVRVHFVNCDVTSKDNWEKAWDEAEETLGGKIEILCNNAGVPPRVSKVNSRLTRFSKKEQFKSKGWN